LAGDHENLLKSRPAFFIFRLMVIPFLIVIPVHFFMHDGRMHPSGMWAMGRDFINYWSGARLALAGETETLSKVGEYIAYLKNEFGQGLDGHNWSYPPHTLLLIWPLALLPYLWAFGLWTFSGLAALYYSLKRLTGNIVDARVLLLAPATFLCIFTGQNGLFSASIILLSFAVMKKRPILAGILIGCLTFKPQLGILFPLVLLLMRKWTVFVSAAITTMALIGLSILIFGQQMWIDYISVILPLQTEILALPHTQFSRMVPSIFMMIKNLGVSMDVAWICQYAVSGFVLLSVIWGFIKERPFGLQIALFCTGSLLFTPYIANYDMIILAPAVYLYYRYLKVREIEISGIKAAFLVVVALSPLIGQVTQSFGVPTFFIILFAFHITVLNTLRHSVSARYGTAELDGKMLSSPIPGNAI